MAKDTAYKPKRQYVPQDKKRMFSPAMLVAVFFGGIMVTSTLGFIGAYSGGEAGSIVYGDYNFVRTQRGYGVTVNDVQLEFSYFPDVLKDIEISDDIVTLLGSTKSIIVTYDPESSLNQSAGLIQYNLEQLYDNALNSYAQRSVTNNTLFPSLSQATCADATQFVPVLILEEGNETKFVREGNCVHAIARYDQDAIRLHDRLAYRLLGVMSE